MLLLKDLVVLEQVTINCSLKKKLTSKELGDF